MGRSDKLEVTVERKSSLPRVYYIIIASNGPLTVSCHLGREGELTSYRQSCIRMGGRYFQ